MGNKRKVHVTSYFICQECNNEMYLPRVPGEKRKREKEDILKMFIVLIVKRQLNSKK